MYEKIRNTNNTINDKFIKRLDDGAIVPFDIDNRDYWVYQSWIDAGGVPQTPPMVTISIKDTLLQPLVK